jgi:uncharacterized protein (UPF0218 family)
LRQEFKKAYGELFTSVSNISKLIEDKFVIAIGDVICYNMLQAGLTPRIMIFDRKEKRQEIPLKMRFVLETSDAKTFKVKNPPGCVTDELWNSIKQSLSLTTNAKIIVDGEEDMAFLPAVLECSVGDVILYGFFDKGFVLTNVDNNLKEKCKNLLSKMERVEGR